MCLDYCGHNANFDMLNQLIIKLTLIINNLIIKCDTLNEQTATAVVGYETATCGKHSSVLRRGKKPPLRFR